MASLGILVERTVLGIAVVGLGFTLLILAIMVVAGGPGVILLTVAALVLALVVGTITEQVLDR